MTQLVSILIPAFNAERWIRATIDSAVTQTWPRVEVIVVDDGSTDRTAEAARCIAHPNVMVLKQDNRGASAARNTALSLAQGAFIQWLDADDLLAPDKIERQMLVARDQPASTLYSGAFGEFFTDPRRAVFLPTALWHTLSPIDFVLRKFTDNLWMTPACWLASRELSDATGPWDERLSLDDDGEYFTRLTSKASSIRFVPEARMFYRRGNPSSLSRATSHIACESLLLSLRLCCAHLLALEDSPRTHQACLGLLQNWVDRSDCFCPDAPERFERASVFARELGGELMPHRISWKYAPVKALFGWKAARRTRNAWSNAKLAARLRLESMLANGPTTGTSR